MKRKLLCLIFTILLMFTVACQQATKGVESSITGEDNIKRIKITAQNANVRQGCSANSPTLQTLNKDTALDVINKVADWYAVKLPDNTVGFVPQNQSTPIIVDNKPTNPGTGTGTTPITPGTGTGTTPIIPGTGTGTTPATPGKGTPNVPGTPNNTTNNTSQLSSQEQEMLRLVNAARAQNNVSALTADIELSNVARIKSQDMIDNNYFSHNSPKYGSPFDMMKKFGIEYVKAGENIAGNQTVQKAHEALMNSPGHRKNILSPDYTHIGIGIKSGGTYGNMFTQMFISKPR